MTKIIIKYDELISKLDETLFDEYRSSLIKDKSVGASVYELIPEKNIFGDAFKLITSNPKSFRYSLISTADTSYNSILSYLDVCKWVLLDKNKEYLSIHQIQNIELNKLYCFEIEDLNIYISIRKQTQKKVIEKINFTASIFFTNKNLKKIILVSIPLVVLDYQFIRRVFLEKNRGSNSIFSIIQDIINDNSVKTFDHYIENNSNVQTNLIFFTDITNSTRLVNEYTREGLFFVKNAIEKIAEVIEKEGFIVNEILGDGILYSMPLIKLSELNDVEQKLISLNKNIFLSYREEKKRLLKIIKKTNQQDTEEYIFENIKNILDNTYLKTATAIDGTYFLPFNKLSYNRSIMYGKKLWNMEKVFRKYENEKNSNDIFVYDKEVDKYLKIFTKTSMQTVQSSLENISIKVIYNS